MSMDPWYLLKCSNCRVTLRIKSAYVHMQGKCPACQSRISAPIPKPLSFSDEAVVQDEQWPEPPEVLTEQKTEAASYNLQSVSGARIDVPKASEEEEVGGVYTLAFDPDAPKTPGITRSAEWDQVNTPTVVPPKSVPILVSPIPTVVPTESTNPVIAYQTEVDPLFGDEVKVPVAVAPPPSVKAASGSAKPQPAPVARHATPAELPPKLEPEVPLPPPESPVVLKKKAKKQQADQTPSESFAHLDKPTEETHLYRLSMFEENRIKTDAPPKSIFIDGVFNFPWQPKNLIPWIWLSIYFTFNFLILATIQHILDSGSSYAMVGAAGLGMAMFMVSVFTLSYGCACWSNTINYTSAGSREVGWEMEGWRENVIVFLRVGYYFALAMMMATPLLVFNFINIGTYLWLMGALFLFPVFLFSGMASLTFWNFMHGDVIKKFIVKGHFYLVMYFISVAMFFVAGIAVYFTMRLAWLALLSGPLFAAAWLIYGRLLGRMAYLLQQTKKKKKKKKKKVESAESDGAEDETALDEVNEKGPREDARGPGGARPV